MKFLLAILSLLAVSAVRLESQEAKTLADQYGDQPLREIKVLGMAEDKYKGWYKGPPE